ncbi:hypothetical protein F4861DRAFT_291328 [Xylaria intraflava]|nr:hypothetical protein F4861DRAFT_291328 [Xylaria intraflava]
MAPEPYTPRWVPVETPQEPFSWVFFVVARIAGRHRPVAVVTSMGYYLDDPTLQGYPLTVACHRIVTIFSDRANRLAIRAELGLANIFYAEDGGKVRHLEPIELPELSRIAGGIENFSLRRRPWDCGRVSEFPFITTCLLQGVAFDAKDGGFFPVRPEPLGTVYHDSSKEWGMVVVDITDLDTVRYGIVGFSSARMVFKSYEGPLRSMGGILLDRTIFRLMDEERPRRAMLAAEFMTRWDRDYLSIEHNPDSEALMSKLLAPIPLIDVDAMDLVWPPDPPNDAVVVQQPSEDPDGSITKLVESTLGADDFDLSAFDLVRTLPDFQEILRRNVAKRSAQLGKTQSSGKLIRLAFTDKEHLGLETLPAVSVEAIGEALDVSGMSNLTSISLCIDNIIGTPARLVDTLTRAEMFRELVFLQSPTHPSDALGVQLFEELSARPQILRRAKVVLSAAYSAALSRKTWPPAIPRSMVIDKKNFIQTAPLDVFPVQQMFVRQRDVDSSVKFSHFYVHIGDAFLKPNRFAYGFLLWLRNFVDGWGLVDIEKRFFGFTSAPSSLAQDAVTAAEISPILTENVAVISKANGYMGCSARVHDLVPDGWTVMVLEEELARPHHGSFIIRYGFVRPRQQPIAIDATLLAAPRPEDLEVIGLEEFLAITAPGVNSAVIENHLKSVENGVAAAPYQETLPPGIETLLVLTPEKAADMLPGFLADAKVVNEQFRVATERTSEE